MEIVSLHGTFGSPHYRNSDSPPRTLQVRISYAGIDRIDLPIQLDLDEFGLSSSATTSSCGFAMP
jgi:hypothetical protein